MLTTIQSALWRQFSASMDMLGNAVASFPEDYWQQHKKPFYTTFHVLFFLDYYLSNPPQTFAPRLPFNFVPENEIPADAIDDIVPKRFYTREELLAHLDACREKCRRAIAGFSEENIGGMWIEEEKHGGRNFVFLELLLFNMRHVQHHTAQLQTMLRGAGVRPPEWINRGTDDLENSPE